MKLVLFPIAVYYVSEKSLKNNTKSFILVKTSDHQEGWTRFSRPRAQRAGFQNSVDPEIFLKNHFSFLMLMTITFKQIK